MSLSVQDLSHSLRCADAVTGAKSLISGFTPAGLGERVSGEFGPDTNRGQKLRVSGFAVSIDWLTVSIPLARLEACSATNFDYLAQFLLGGVGIRVMRPSGRGMNFYKNSAIMLDREGELCGHVCFGGKDQLMFDLTGSGCRWVKNWDFVARQLELVGASISRVDIAFDDFEGKVFNIRALEALAVAGAFKGAGRPPKTRFIDDHGNGTGCTLYVGKKGHKECCAYEKGKEQKDETSPWTRVEQRYYSKHFADPVTGEVSDKRGLPYAMLTAPLRYWRGAHALLAQMTESISLDDVVEVLHIVKAKVEATATAAVKWLKEQCGPTLGLLWTVLGDDAERYLRKNVTRESLPSRFKGLGAGDQLHELLRNQLCASM